MPAMREQQTACTVLMVRPAAFVANDQTASSNHFQTNSAPTADLNRRARTEFDGASAALRDAGVDVVVLHDTPEPAKPDAVFPNNWLSTHADGTVVLYPMLAPNRRPERRHDALEHLRSSGFCIRDVVDLSRFELTGDYLEGTGSLVLDRVNRIAYACRSPRTTEAVLEEFASRMNYRTVLFDATDERGRRIYHTNVLLSVGRQFAAVCFECMSAADAERVQHQLRATKHTIIALTLAQLAAFAGNILELATSAGFCVAMSSTAKRALTAGQRSLLEELSGPIVAADIPTIERHGGGSMRCMLAEIHLPRKTDPAD